MKIHYQCSNCGKRFISNIVPDSVLSIYYSGCRAIGSSFYCKNCVKTWKERNGEEFDEQYENSKEMLADWLEHEMLHNRFADLGDGERIAKLAKYEDLEERLQAALARTKNESNS